MTAGRAVFWTPSGTQDFSVAPRAIADVMKAVLAQALVAITVQRGEIVGAEPADAAP